MKHSSRIGTGYSNRNPAKTGKIRMPSSDTQFKPGQSGNPAGRPPGSRNKLSEAYLKALADDFEEHGVKTIQELREDRPDIYVGAIGKLMPKLMELSGPDGDAIPVSGTVNFVRTRDE